MGKTAVIKFKTEKDNKLEESSIYKFLTTHFKDGDELYFHDKNKLVANWDKIKELDQIKNFSITDKKKAQTIIRNVVNYLSSIPQKDLNKDIFAVNFELYKALGKEKLNKEYMDIINANSDILKKENAESLAQVIVLMQKNKIPATHLINVLNLENTQLQNLKNAMTTVRLNGAQFADILSGEKLSASTEMNKIVDILGLMKKHKIPLSDKNNNLRNLMGKSSAEISGIHSILIKMKPLNKKGLLAALSFQKDSPKVKELPKDKDSPKELSEEQIAAQTTGKFESIVNIINVLKENKLSLNDNLSKLVGKGAEELDSIYKLVSADAKINQATLDIILKGSKSLDTKVNEVRNSIQIMQDKKLSLTHKFKPKSAGEQTNLEFLMRMPKDQLKRVNTLLDAIDPLTQKRFEAVANNISESLQDAKDQDSKVEKLKKSIEILQDKKLPLVNDVMEKITFDSLAGIKGNLDSLMGKSETEIEGMNSLLSIMDPLTQDRFDTAFANIGKVLDDSGQLDKTKISQLETSIKSIQKSLPKGEREEQQKNGIPLSNDNENLKRLMHLSPDELKDVNALLGVMKPVTQARFDAIVDRYPWDTTKLEAKKIASSLKGKSDALKTSIELLQKVESEKKEEYREGIPLSNGNLEKLMRLSKEQIENVNIILEAVKPVTQKRFDVVYNNALTRDVNLDKKKAELLATSIRSMQKVESENKKEYKEGIPLSDGNRNLEKLMNLPTAQIRNVNMLLQKMDPVTQKRFDVVYKNATTNNPKIKLNKYKATALADSIDLMQKVESENEADYKEGIPLSDSNRNLERLMGLSSSQIKEANKILKVMKPITQQQFDVMYKYKDRLINPSRTGPICDFIRLMQKHKIPPTDSSRYLAKGMGKLAGTIKNMNKILQTMEDTGRLNEKRFQVVINNSKEISELNADSATKTEAICDSIKIMHRNKVPLSDSQNNLERLMALNLDQIKAINGIFDKLDQYGADEEAFKVIAKNIEKLGDPDKCRLIADCIELAGGDELTEGLLSRLFGGEKHSLQKLIDMKLEEDLKQFKEMLEKPTKIQSPIQESPALNMQPIADSLPASTTSTQPITSTAESEKKAERSKKTQPSTPTNHKFQNLKSALSSFKNEQASREKQKTQPERPQSDKSLS